MNVHNFLIIFSLLNLTLACIPTKPTKPTQPPPGPSPQVLVKEIVVTKVVKVPVPASTMQTTKPQITNTTTTTTMTTTAGLTATTTTTAAPTMTACAPLPACQTEVLGFSGILTDMLGMDTTLELLAPTLTLANECAEDGAILLVECPFSTYPLISPGPSASILAFTNVGRLFCTSLGWIGNSIERQTSVPLSTLANSVSCIDDLSVFLVDV